MDDWKLKTTPVVKLERPSEAFVYFPGKPIELSEGELSASSSVAAAAAATGVEVLRIDLSDSDVDVSASSSVMVLSDTKVASDTVTVAAPIVSLPAAEQSSLPVKLKRRPKPSDHERQYCRIEGCNKVYGTRQSMGRHMRTVHGANPKDYPIRRVTDSSTLVAKPVKPSTPTKQKKLLKKKMMMQKSALRVVKPSFVDTAATTGAAVSLGADIAAVASLHTSDDIPMQVRAAVDDSNDRTFPPCPAPPPSPGVPPEVPGAASDLRCYNVRSFHIASKNLQPEQISRDAEKQWPKHIPDIRSTDVCRLLNQSSEVAVDDMLHRLKARRAFRKNDYTTLHHCFAAGAECQRDLAERILFMLPRVWSYTSMYTALTRIRTYVTKIARRPRMPPLV